jgi:segregation and condensation protein A
MPYVVKTHVFEGPLHLLLDLLEKRKLLINDISLTTVADDFLTHIKELPELPLDETAEFIALAATLLLMKSRSLLPLLTLSEEEKEDVATLERRLAMLALMRERSVALTKAFGSSPLYSQGDRAKDPVFAPDRFTEKGALRAAIEAVFLSFPKVVELPKAAVKKVLSLEDMIMRLTERISREISLSFKQFAGGAKAEKGDVIVSFLALLELVKQGIINATQERDFADITLESENVHTPSYGA